MITIALYQPDIPQNVGAMARLCACLGAGLDVIDPCGFLWDERKLKSAGLDYTGKITIQRHASWVRFIDHYRGKSRLILMTTQGDTPYHEFSFRAGDILLAGRESAGVPQNVHKSADARVFIPMETGFRSLNIVNASAMVLGEALRQTQWKQT